MQLHYSGMVAVREKYANVTQVLSFCRSLPDQPIGEPSSALYGDGDPGRHCSSPEVI